MLILVAVTVNVALSGGLFGTARDAAIETEMEAIRERAEVVKATLMADSQRNENIKFDIKTYKERLVEEFKDSKAGKSAKVIVENEKYDIIILDSDLNIEVRIHSEEDSFLAKTDIASGDNVYNKYIEWNDGILAVADVGTKQEIVEGFLTFYINYTNVKMANGTLIHDNLDEWIQDKENKEIVKLVMEEFLDGIDMNSVTTKVELYQKLIELVNKEPGVNITTEEQVAEFVYKEWFGEKTEKEICSNSWISYVYKDGAIIDIKANIGGIFNDSKEYNFKKKGNYEIVLKSITGQELGREKIDGNNIIDNNYEFFLEEGDKNWETDGKGTIIKCNIDSSTKEIAIPYKIGNEKIIGIGANTNILSYKIEDQIEKIIIPNGVKNINNRAFYYCDALQFVSLPDSLTLIGDEAFSGRETRRRPLSEITIPGGVKYIGKGAFAYSALTKIVLQEGVETIGAQAFLGNQYLREVSLPSTLKKIEDQAFAYFTACNSPDGGILEKAPTIYIPEGVEEISETAFVGCGANLEVDERNKNYSSIDGVLFNKDKTELLHFPLLREGSYTIPKGVKIIGKCAFYMGGSLLDEIILQEGLERIEDYGLCMSVSTTIDQKIKDITIPNSVTYIGENAIGCYTENIYFAPGDNPIPEGRPWGADSANIQKLEN